MEKKAVGVGVTVQLFLAAVIILLSAIFAPKLFEAEAQINVNDGLGQVCPHTKQTLGYYEKFISNALNEHRKKPLVGDEKLQVGSICADYKKCFEEDYARSGPNSFCDSMIDPTAFDLALKEHQDLIRQLAGDRDIYLGVGTYWYRFEPKQWKQQLTLAIWGLERKNGRTTDEEKDLKDFKTKLSELVSFQTEIDKEVERIDKIWIELIHRGPTTFNDIVKSNQDKKKLIEEIEKLRKKSQQKHEEFYPFITERLLARDGFSTPKYNFYFTDQDLIKEYENLIKQERNAEDLERIKKELKEKGISTEGLSDEEILLMGSHEQPETLTKKVAAITKFNKAKKQDNCFSLQAGILEEYLKSQKKEPRYSSELAKMQGTTAILQQELNEQEWEEYSSLYRQKRGTQAWDRDGKLTECINTYGDEPIFPSENAETQLLFDFYQTYRVTIGSTDFLLKRVEGFTVPLDDIKKDVLNYQGMTEQGFNDVMQTLLLTGELYEYKPGQIAKRYTE